MIKCFFIIIILSVHPNYEISPTFISDVFYYIFCKA